MDADRLAEIREHGLWNLTVRELLGYVDELTRQRDDARRIAICTGIFQDHRGEDYEMDSDAAGTVWRADPVGPVAWTKPLEQT